MLFYRGRQRILDSNGDPVSGAKLNFYLTGTTTRADTYTDSDLTTEHANPVIASAAGFVEPIYLDPAVTYKVVITTSNDVALPDGTVDPVSAGLDQDAVGALANPITAAETAATVTPTDYTVPSHETLGYVNAARYGFASSASGATNYTALVNAHAVAVQAAVSLMTPAGTFTYTPTAAINLAVNWENPALTTLNCAMSAYSGIVFQQIGSTKIKNVYMQRTGTLQGTALYQAPVTVTDFTGYQVLDRVWAIGFGRNLQIGNVFMQSYKNCRFNDGTTGIYCVPDSSTGNGYVTTLHFDSCEVFGNAQNYLFTSTLQSRGVTFTNCSGENPTTTGSTFTKIRGLHFQSCYFEGSSSIKALILNDCSANFGGQCYLNGTAGITLGTNTEATIKGVRVGSATDVLTGADGTQIVSLEDCQFPGSGNSVSFLRFTAINSQVNGTWFQMDGQVTGSFTGTLTGCTTSPTNTITYAMADGIVTLNVPAVTAESNSTAATITGMPAAIRPASTRNVMALATDSGTDKSSIWSIATDGTISLYNGVSATFTGSGTKGVGVAMCVTYKVAA